MPPGVTGTYGPRARRWAKRELGLTPTPWQSYVIDNLLRHTKGGDLASRIALVGTGRQNGKSVIVRIVVGWMLDEGRLLPPFRQWPSILAAAHDANQARIIYTGVYNDLIGVPRLREASKGGRFDRTVKLTEMFGIRVGDLVFDTVTSQPGSIRGKSAGLVALDEVLTQRDWEMYAALSPVISAQRSSLILMTSTAGNPESVVLRRFYDRLRRQVSGEDAPDATFYGVWWESEDPNAGLDWEQIAQANPSLGDGRLSRTLITEEYNTFPQEQWRRERLNHWNETVADLAIPAAQWAACQVDRPLEEASAPYAMGIDVDPGWTRATISVAAIRPDGRVGVEVYRDIREDVTVETLVREVAAFPEPVRVIAYPGSSGAASAFRRDGDLTQRPYDELTPGMVVSACMDVAEMIGSGRLAVGDPLLTAQSQMVARRDIGTEGAFRFSRKHSTGPVDAFMSMTYAAHAAAFQERGPQVFF